MDSIHGAELIDLRKVLAERCIAERESRGWSLAVLGARAGLSEAYISRIEKGSRQASLAAVSRLAAAFGVSAAELLTVDSQQPVSSAALTIGQAIEISGLRYETYSSPIDIPFDAFRVTVLPGRTHASWQSHPGAEWLYVLTGALTLSVGPDEYVLEQGMGVCMNSNQRHKLSNTSENPCSALVLMVN